MGNICYMEHNLRHEKKNKSLPENRERSEVKEHKEKEAKINKPIKNDNNKNNHPKENLHKIMDIKDIYKYVYNQHNKIRKQYNFKELILNNDLTILAQKFADNFELIEEANLPIEKYKGENIGINYEKFNEDINYIINICDKWIKERELMIKKIYSSKTKHFTQIIWKNTKEIGFGYSKLNNGQNIFVVYYYPAGNIFSEL